MAFVDSKMAELRSVTPNAQPNGNVYDGAAAMATQEESEVRAATGNTATTTAPGGAQRRQQNARQPRSQRRGHVRGAQDVARDSLIEDIMRESATSTPIYDRPAFTAPTQDTDDAEDAAAEAFKAQFMLETEEQNRRRPPAPPPFSKVAQAKGAERTAHGPKLGGSRQQRERMKAAQAAAEAAEKAKK